MWMKKFLGGALLAFLCAFAAFLPHAQAQNLDSSKVNGAGALQPSYCPNVNGVWYPWGSVPGGYYKAKSGAGDCKPIPACPSNQIFSTDAEMCMCPAGTIWDGAYGSCHVACTGGRIWNGYTCVLTAASCTPTQTWNGSSCVDQPVCTSGQTWNGSACGVKPRFGYLWAGGLDASHQIPAVPNGDSYTYMNNLACRQAVGSHPITTDVSCRLVSYGVPSGTPYRFNTGPVSGVNADYMEHYWAGPMFDLDSRTHYSCTMTISNAWGSSSYITGQLKMNPDDAVPLDPRNPYANACPRMRYETQP